MIFDHLPSVSPGSQSAGSQAHPRDTPHLHLLPSLPPFSSKKGEDPLFDLPYSSIAALSCPLANHLAAAWSR